MNQKEIDDLYKSLLDDEGDLSDDNWNEYYQIISDAGGADFWAPWSDYMHDAMHPEEHMIEFMKKNGFTVLDDPHCKDSEANGWIVFPPKKEVE